jgi:tRNA (mo5U34)-methyltransferase
MPDHRSIRWFHSIDLGNGIVTEGAVPLAALQNRCDRFGLTAEMLRGRRVLDIGCADGYIALHCARLGADVTAIDGVNRDSLRYVLEHAETKFRFYCVDLLSPSFLELGHFDIILYLGVLYHTVYPYEHLKRVALASRPGAIVFIQSNFYNLPGMEQAATVFYDYEQQVNVDPTSPAFPSVPWIYGTLHRLGFDQVIEISEHPMGIPTAGAPDPDGKHIGSIELRPRYSGEHTSPFLYAFEQQYAPDGG